MVDGRIFLRRSKLNHPFIPYTYETDSEDPKLKGEIKENRDVFIYPLSVDGGYVILSGCIPKIFMPLGTATDDDLSERTYECACQFGREIARTHPDDIEFVDDTGGAVEINIETLGKLRSRKDISNILQDNP